MARSECVNEFQGIFRQAEKYGKKLDTVQDLQLDIENIERVLGFEEIRVKGGIGREVMEVLEEYKRNLPDKKEELKIQKGLFDLEESRLKNAIEKLIACECGEFTVKTEPFKVDG